MTIVTLGNQFFIADDNADAATSPARGRHPPTSVSTTPPYPIALRPNLRLKGQLPSGRRNANYHGRAGRFLQMPLEEVWLDSTRKSKSAFGSRPAALGPSILFKNQDREFGVDGGCEFIKSESAVTITKPPALATPISRSQGFATSLRLRREPNPGTAPRAGRRVCARGLLLCHTACQPSQHIPYGNAQTSDAGLTGTFAGLNCDPGTNASSISPQSDGLP
jgi:hypothetical protein